MSHPARTEPTESVRVLPGMSEGWLLVTAYSADGTPLIRMDMPADWLTPGWIAWMERLVAQRDPSRPTLQLLG